MEAVSPYVTAALKHQSFGLPVTFGQALEAHAFIGYVFISPGLFLLGRRVNHDWSDEQLQDLATFDPTGDCWFIYLAAGDLAEAVGLIPEHLPFVSYVTKGRKRVMSLEKFIARLPNNLVC